MRARLTLTVLLAVGALTAWFLFNRPGSWQPDSSTAGPGRAAEVRGCWTVRKAGRPDPFLPGQLLLGFDTTSMPNGLRRLIVDTTVVKDIQVANWAPAANGPFYRGSWGTGPVGLSFRVRFIGAELHGRVFRYAPGPQWPSSFVVVATRQACNGLLPN